MRQNFPKCLQMVLETESGLTDDPIDPGGITNLGVTARAWENWTGMAATYEVMRDLTVAEVTPFYQEEYWDKVNGDNLPLGLDYSVFDAAVNQGPEEAAKMLQKAVGAIQDGVIGVQTLKAVMAVDLMSLIEEFADLRIERYQNTKDFSIYGVGWVRRACQVELDSKKMGQ